MKKVLLTSVAALALTSTAALAEISLGPVSLAPAATVEYDIDAESTTLTLETGATYSIVTVSASIDFDAGNEFDNLGSTLGASAAIWKNVTGYAEANFDGDFDHTNTVVGVSISF